MDGGKRGKGKGEDRMKEVGGGKMKEGERSKKGRGRKGRNLIGEEVERREV